jgi:hypothetical protein
VRTVRPHRCVPEVETASPVTTAAGRTGD